EEKEIVNENPFLSDFYEDISKWSFQTEMFFLCNRYKQFQDLEAISTGIVSDYHIYKNKIFANNTLTPSEFNKFSRIYDILRSEEKEIVYENPFLSDFYEDISKWSFQTEMFFLCNRYKQFQDLEAISTGIVSDYHIYKNKIFANNTLTPSEFNKFSRIYDILTEDLEMPNVIIFLDADLEILKKRIALRNRSFEHQIEDDYLLNLKRDYNAYYRSLKADGEIVIRID